ncbi:MAG: alanine racemase [Cardiobacteriaceae bacterium]|nr:alanine racemase [Cardiobacteriaceae bacterium]
MRPLVKTLSLEAIKHNLSVLQALASPAQLVVVVKANAYGHDAVAVASVIPEQVSLAVACLEEALVLREAGFRHEIWLLEGIFSAEESALCAMHDLVVCVHQMRQLEWLANSRYPHKLWIKLDSGMHRLGFLLDDKRWQSALAQNPQLQCLGIMSHFACADEEDLSHARTQLDLLHQSALPYPRSFCNSAALLRLPEARADVVRAGLALYGILPYDDKQSALHPALRLETEMIAVRYLRAGENAGYGRHFTAPHDGYLATIALGYGDGFPRAIESGKVKVYWQSKQRRVPLVGRVSMDMSLVWLGEQSALEGEKIVIFGEENPIEQLAKEANTIPYTLCTMLTSRVALAVR